VALHDLLAGQAAADWQAVVTTALGVHGLAETAAPALFERELKGTYPDRPG
jgi:hypothetical protein